MCAIPLVQASIKCKLIYSDSNRIVVSLARGGEGGVPQWHKEVLGVMDLLIILIWVIISQ